MVPATKILAALAAGVHLASAITIDVNNVYSVRAAARQLAFGVQSWYHNNQSTTAPEAVGTLPQPSYWWQAGAVWGGMVDYWAYTNDTSYNEVTTQALLAQVGPDWNYMPPAYFSSLGNDDQAFWGIAALTAAEHHFPFPSGQRVNGWIDLAVAVWNTQNARWNMGSCNGGLKWQIFESNNGFDYKNSISNGAFMQISARLARYTGNQTYVEAVNRTWNWMSGVGLISPTYHVFDGTDDKINCSQLNHIEWTYNPAMVLYASAVMANYTTQQVWKDRTDGLLTNIEHSFFSPYENATDIMFEPACEPYETCNYDQNSFKAYLARWMAKSAVVYPSITNSVRKRLSASAIAAAKSCTGDNGQTCGRKWYTGGYDGVTNVGAEQCALETVQSLLLLTPGWAVRSVPNHQLNVHIQHPPVTSMFPLNPTPIAPASPDSTRKSSAALTRARTNLPGSIRATTTASENSVLKRWMVLSTPIVLALAFGRGIGW